MSAVSSWRLPVAVAAALMVSAGCRADARVEAWRPLAPGDPAPAFAATRLDGDSVTLASLRGGPLLLNVWATWCPPCREEMPGLQALHERFAGSGLRVVGVSVDSRGAEDAVRRFLDEGGYTFTILHDPSDSVSRAFRTVGVPETFLVDDAGVIVRRWIGRFDPLAPDVVSEIEALLGP